MTLKSIPRQQSYKDVTNVYTTIVQYTLGMTNIYFNKLYCSYIVNKVLLLTVFHKTFEIACLHFS